ncbi:MAG: hypothetical protein WCK84_07895 [Bacteroidota bacterium]
MIPNFTNTLNMSDMDITSDWIDRYNENELNEDEKIFFMKRMENNPLLRNEVFIDACLNKLYQDQGTMDLMKKIQQVSRKTDREEGILKYLLIAASLLYLIAFGAILNLIQNDPVDIPNNFNPGITEIKRWPADRTFTTDFLKVPVQVKNITPITRSEISHKQLLALNYIPLADFELLVGSVTRSAYMSLIAPSAFLKISAGDNVIFEWIYKSGLHPISILFFNNRGNLVFEATDLRTDSYIISTKEWLGGIYYWKIIIDDEMIFMGKLTLL